MIMTSAKIANDTWEKVAILPKTDFTMPHIRATHGKIASCALHLARLFVSSHRQILQTENEQKKDTRNRS